MKKTFLLILTIFLLFANIYGNGKWEVGIHYSYWSINFAKPFIEKGLEDVFDNFDSNKGDLNFDSNGNNYGIDLRYYPKGKYGSFSLGVSYEKNNFKGDLSGNYKDTIYGVSSEISAIGIFNIQPHSFNFSLRWDIAPKYRVHPFFGFGFGIGRINGFINGTITGTTAAGAIVSEINEETTLTELIEEYEEEEGKKFPLSFFPIIYFSIGVKGEITNNIYFLGEVAVYDGLIFRGGFAFKF